MPHYLELLLASLVGAASSRLYPWIRDLIKYKYRYVCPECAFRIRANYIDSRFEKVLSEHIADHENKRKVS